MVPFIFYGLVSALVVGVERAFACDLAPEAVRGTALGTLHTSIGLVALPAGLIAGVLWQHIGSWATFTCGGALGLAAGVLMLWFYASSRPEGLRQCQDE